MKQYEILELKKQYFSRNKFKKKIELNLNQKSLIFLILIFMLTFLLYKILYFILIIIENKNSKPPKQNINMENIPLNQKTNQEINNKDKNGNITKYINEDIIIPISYSKNLEDLILNSLFYNIKNGFYIDIGNFGENKTSATKFFYLKGWSGMNIKPLNDEYNELINKRPKDININYYKGGKMKTKFFFQGYNDTNHTYHKISDIFEDYLPKKKVIHFCKIDMKKDVRKILLGYDFENYRPKIFCIETNNGTFTYEIFEYILNKNDYSFIYQYEMDRYYLDNKIINLKERVGYIDGIIQAFKAQNKNDI